MAGAIELWLHPGAWPETSIGQVRRIASTLTFALAVTAALVTRRFGPAQLAPTGHHPARAVWLLLLVAAGVALVAPAPRLQSTAFARALGVTARTMALPAIATLTILAVAHTGWVEHPAAPVRAVLAIGYWAVLALGGVRICHVIAHPRRRHRARPQRSTPATRAHADGMRSRHRHLEHTPIHDLIGNLQRP